MARKLTPIAVEKLKPGTTRREVRDGGCAHLYLVVQPSGHKSWAARFRFEGAPRKLTLGAWPNVSVSSARKLTMDALSKLEGGEDPAATKRKTKAEALDRERDTVAFRAAQFLEQHAKRKTRFQTWQNSAGIFRRDILPAWGRCSVHDIKRRDVIELVEKIAEARPVMANRILSVASKFFGWLEARDVITVSPTRGVSAPSKETPRERVLSDAEIVRFWKACDAIPEPFGAIYRVLLLCGARRQEVAEMRRRAELDEPSRTWRLPPERVKNNESRIIPLPQQAWNLITAQPHIAGSDFVFSRRAAFGNIKPLLDKAMQPDAPFVTHDLRRTFASGLQKIGTDIVVTEKILGHKSGSLKGVIGVYQKHDYLEEARVALQRWADRIDVLVRGELPDAKVLSFERQTVG
jgi:integrase